MSILLDILRDTEYGLNLFEENETESISNECKRRHNYFFLTYVSIYANFILKEFYETTQKRRVYFLPR